MPLPAWIGGAEKKHPSGVKTPLPRGRGIAGVETPAYRSGLVEARAFPPISR